MRKLNRCFLKWLDKTGVFYLILSAVFAISGEMGEAVTYLLIICSVMGLFMVFLEMKFKK